jgi:lipid A disaccharide synthetase
MPTLYVKDINNVDESEKEIIEALKANNPDLIVVSDGDPDFDIYVVARVRLSKADSLVEHIKGLGFACKKLELA